VSRSRLDDELVRRGLYASRARARDAILRGTVTVNGAVARKPAQAAGPEAAITLADDAQAYVSRAALKLIHALDHFAIAVAGRNALDIGASTGGFTQVLLERGAAHVTAIDVGHGQMAPALAADPRVMLIEGLNARDLTRAHLPGAIDLITCDVSFISLELALPPALALAADRAGLVALIKPQFEVGRDRLGKGGLVTGAADHQRVCERIAAFIGTSGWRVKGIVPSPLLGGDGNREFLMAAERG
jgi:23S rRNA (cytidine1920-2'-O)/16S rRNA (cytidine1409-2'-O)-methyltransferase